VIHRSSFGEDKDKEGTFGSFVMSSDVEVYVGTKINDEEITPPPPSANGINDIICAAEPKARQLY
jgi:hypothetical protein